MRKVKVKNLTEWEQAFKTGYLVAAEAYRFHPSSSRPDRNEQAALRIIKALRTNTYGKKGAN